MLDVLIAGAGPAGSMAALVLARAGARVLIVDREVFPRDKLCGDTLNPGAVALLASYRLADGPVARARPLDGMIVTSRWHGVRTVYGDGIVGRAVTRRDLDAWLLDAAIRAGARFESGWVAGQPLVDLTPAGPLVRGLTLTRRGGRETTTRIPASMTIAADGRRSAVARACHLICHPRRPRRWAFGVYASGVAGMTTLGEMHVRRGYYLGLAPLGDDLVNICVVTGPRPEGASPADVIRRAAARDPALQARLERATFVSDVRVLGPLAVEARAAGVNGLLLAGDAAGFIDPMTGDGLHLAMRGAALAAAETLRTLQTGDFRGAVERLGASRRDALGAKLRFNRAMRALVDSPVAVDAATLGAHLAPGLIRRLVRYAGDAA